MPDYDNMSPEDFQLELQKQGYRTVPIKQQDPTGMGAAVAQPMATAKDIGRGAYQGSTQAVAGVGGFPGDVANTLYDVASPTGRANLGLPANEHSPFFGSADAKTLIDKGVKAVAGDVPGEPTSAIGNLAKYGTAYAPAIAMPGQAARGVAGRFLENVAAPAAASTAAGAFTDDPRLQYAAALTGARAINPIGGRAAQMAPRIAELRNTYQARENAFRADPNISQAVKDHYAMLSGAKEQNQWLTRNYPGVNPKGGVTWHDIDKEMAQSNDIARGQPFRDLAAPIGALAAGIYGYSKGSPYGYGSEAAGLGGLGGYVGLRGLKGIRIPLPREHVVGALFGNKAGRTLGGSVLYSAPARTERAED